MFVLVLVSTLFWGIVLPWVVFPRFPPQFAPYSTSPFLDTGNRFYDLIFHDNVLRAENGCYSYSYIDVWAEVVSHGVMVV